jgi:hypothetical protein
MVRRDDFCTPQEKQPEGLYMPKNTSMTICVKHLLETCGRGNSRGIKKMGKITKILSCLIVIAILISVVPWATVAQDVSHSVTESKHIQEQAAAKEFKIQVYSSSVTLKGISNDKIADIAVSYNGQNLGSTGGQCKAFVQKVISEAGGSLGTGYRQCYLDVGEEIQSSEATRGDIIQLNKDSDPENFYSGMHTAIVLENYGNGKFKVVDSNWNFNTTVRIHDWTPSVTASNHNLQVHFYRLGEINTIAAVSTYNTILDDLDELVSNGKIPGYDLYTDSNIDQLWVNLDQYKTLLIDEDCIFEWTNPCNPDCNKPIPTTTVGVSFYNHKAQLKQWIFNGGGFFSTDQNDVSPDYLHNVWWTWLPDELQVESNEYPSDYPDIGYGHYPYNLEVIYDPGIFSYPNLIDITKVDKVECHGRFTDFESHGYIALVQDKSDNDILEVYRTYGTGYVVLSHVEYETAHPWDVDYIENEIHFVAPVVEETKIVGNVTNTTDYPLENVDMYLYDAKDSWEVLNFIISWFFDPTTPVPPYIRNTKTNSTGNYNFTALTPGSYLVLAVPQFDTGYQPKASDVRAVAKDETEIINLQLERIRYLAMLDDEMVGGKAQYIVHHFI